MTNSAGDGFGVARAALHCPGGHGTWIDGRVSALPTLSLSQPDA
jgi:hypothetical protein